MDDDASVQGRVSCGLRDSPDPVVIMMSSLQVEVRIQLSAGKEFQLDLELFAPVIPEESEYKIRSNKVEVREGLVPFLISFSFRSYSGN